MLRWGRRSPSALRPNAGSARESLRRDPLQIEETSLQLGESLSPSTGEFSVRHRERLRSVRREACRFRGTWSLGPEPRGKSGIDAAIPDRFLLRSPALPPPPSLHKHNQISSRPSRIKN